MALAGRTATAELTGSVAEVAGAGVAVALITAAPGFDAAAPTGVPDGSDGGVDDACP